MKEITVEVEPARRQPLQKAVYPKKSPFTGVRWEGDKPVVKIGEEWFALVSLDGIAAGDIVAFSRRTYASERWTDARSPNRALKPDQYQWTLYSEFRRNEVLTRCHIEYMKRALYLELTMY